MVQCLHNAVQGGRQEEHHWKEQADYLLKSVYALERQEAVESACQPDAKMTTERYDYGRSTSRSRKGAVNALRTELEYNKEQVDTIPIIFGRCHYFF
jgi:hypothetical protein